MVWIVTKMVSVFAMTMLRAQSVMSALKDTLDIPHVIHVIPHSLDILNVKVIFSRLRYQMYGLVN